MRGVMRREEERGGEVRRSEMEVMRRNEEE